MINYSSTPPHTSRHQNYPHSRPPSSNPNHPPTRNSSEHCEMLLMALSMNPSNYRKLSSRCCSNIQVCCDSISPQLGNGSYIGHSDMMNKMDPIQESYCQCLHLLLNQSHKANIEIHSLSYSHLHPTSLLEFHR